MLKTIRPLMRVMLKLIATIILVICLSSFPAEAKNLYVNNSGIPACSDATTYINNTAGTPWCTFLRAVRGNSDGNRNTAGVAAEAADAGDTVYVEAGTYDYVGAAYTAGGFMVAPLYEPINTGSAGNWITFEAVGVVTLTGNTGGQAMVIGQVNVEYTKWDGFTINEADLGFDNGVTFMAVSSRDHVRFENLILTGANGAYDDNHAGIMIHGPRDGQCTGGITDIEIRNNTISGFTGTNSNHTGITLYCISQITVENNTIHSNVRGMYMKSSFTGATGASIIRKNLIYNNSTHGISMQTWENYDVYQNILRDNTLSGISFAAGGYYFGTAGPNNVRVINNTFDNNQEAFFSSGVCSQYDANSFRNNISTNSTYVMWSYDTGGVCETTTNIGTDDLYFDYNRYEHSGAFWVNDAAQAVATALSDFQSGWTNQDANSSDAVDCLYTNEGANDFTLQGGSPCIEGQASDCVDTLDLDGDTSTADAITCGAYITGSEVIGVITGPRPSGAGNPRITDVSYN